MICCGTPDVCSADVTLIPGKMSWGFLACSVLAGAGQATRLFKREPARGSWTINAIGELDPFSGHQEGSLSPLCAATRISGFHSLEGSRGDRPMRNHG